MTAIANLPDLRPSLLLDFANSRRVDPRIQCTRASTATCFGPDGKLRTVESNVPRLDYDPPTGKCLGLLIEESRTNLIVHSNNLSNLAWNRSVSVITVTAEADDWWDISHNGGGNYAAVYQTGLANTSKYATFSFDVKPGSLSAASMLLGINGTSDAARVAFDFAAGSSIISGVLGVITPAMVSHSLKNMGDYWRCTLSVDVSSTSIVPTSNVCYLYTGGVVGMQIAGNIKARRAQLEIGAFPTSYIPTEASAVTRATDLVSLGYTLPTVGAIISSVAAVPSTNSSNAYMWSAINPANQGADHAYLLHNGGPRTTSFWVRKGSVDQAGGSVAGLRLNAGLTYDTGAKTAAIASDTLLGSDTSARPREFPNNLTSLLLGQSRVGSSILNGCLSRLAVYSGQVTNAQLQRLTA